MFKSASLLWNVLITRLSSIAKGHLDLYFDVTTGITTLKLMNKMILYNIYKYVSIIRLHDYFFPALNNLEAE